MRIESCMDRNEKIADAVKLALDAAYYSQDPAGTIRNYLEGLRDDPDWGRDDVQRVEDQIRGNDLRARAAIAVVGEGELPWVIERVAHL